jgi:hypothetical protein
MTQDEQNKILKECLRSILSYVDYPREDIEHRLQSETLKMYILMTHNELREMEDKEHVKH